ncbi:MAG: K(+)-transporting ATPase subunit C [Negativicutes bacterium]|jgi:K+-transporting ATPase ATPase C chain
MRNFLQALKMLIIMTVFLGLLYPLVVYGLAQVIFPGNANGSLITYKGKITGSALIGQQFAQTKYFHGRPSACSYDAANSFASNLGPMNDKLLDGAKTAAAAYRQENGLDGQCPVPADAVLMSGSGLDPDITVANAQAQAGRVAQARKLSKQQVLDLITRNTVEKTGGLMGAQRINVLSLNIALDNGAL